MTAKIFHPMFEHHHAIMLLIDPATGQILDSNQAANHFYGYTTTQMCAMNISEITSKSSAKFMEGLQSSSREELHYVIANHQLASEEIRTVEIDISPVVWQETKMLFAIIHDITKRIQAEEALRESEQKLKTLLELLPVGVSVLNGENKIAYMNPALEEILQISHKGLLQEDYRHRNYLQGDGTPMPTTEFATSRALAEQQAVYNVETGVVLENKQIIWTNVTALPVTFSDWRLIVVTHNITERKQVETALRKKEEQYFLENLFEAIPAPIFYKDTQGHYLACNEAFAAFAGKPMTEIIGQGVFQTFPEAVARKYQTMDAALLAQPNTPQIYEHTAYHPARQEERTMLVTKSVIKNVHNQPTGIVGFMTDITERKQMETELQDRLQFFQLMFENHEAIMILLEPDSGQIIGVNHAASRFYGYTIAQMSAMNIQDINETLLQEQMTIHLTNKHFIVPHRLASGEVRTVEVHSSPIKWKDDIVLFAIIHDITARQRAEDALRKSEQKFRVIMESVSEAIIVIDQSGKIIMANKMTTALFGYTQTELLGQSVELLLPERYRQGHVWYRQGYFVKPEARPMGKRPELVGRRKDGREFPIENGLSYAEFDIGLVAIAFITDITERKQAEEALRKSEERWHYALEGNGDGVWDWNIQTDEAFQSKRWVEMLGYREGEVDRNLSEWDNRIHYEDKARVYEKLAAHLRGETPFYMDEHRMLHQDGSYIWVLARGKVMSWTEEGKALRMVGTDTDITERKRLEQELQAAKGQMEELATHDLLTGLHNRVILMDKLTQALTGCGNQIVAVFTIDMDGFKQINDTYGHPEGDTVLIEVAARMKKLLRESDTLIRLGGDEFMFIAPGVESPAQVEVIATRLLDAVRQPIQLTSVTVSPTFSVGIALCPEDGTMPEIIMLNSDQALYEAKRKGRNCYAFAPH